MTLARLRARWPAVRAGLIAVAIVIGLLDGCPLPPANRTPAWARTAVAKTDAARRWLLRPVQWIGRDLDVSQRWALFRGASRRRFRLYVEGQTATGEWQLLYRAGDADHDAYADVIQYRRVRGTFSPSGQAIRGQYPAFARWMIDRVLADHPDFIAGRTRMERIEIGEGDYTATGEFTFELTFGRRRPR